MSRQENNIVLGSVMNITDNSGLLLNPEKSIFFFTANSIVGIIITKDGIKPNPHKVQALTTATKLPSREDILLFLNMIQPHSTFILGLNTKTKHMKKVTKKHQCFHWSREYQKRFNRLKNSIIKDTLIIYFDPSLKFLCSI